MTGKSSDRVCVPIVAILYLTSLCSVQCALGQESKPFEFDFRHDQVENVPPQSTNLVVLGVTNERVDDLKLLLKNNKLREVRVFGDATARPILMLSELLSNSALDFLYIENCRLRHADCHSLFRGPLASISLVNVELQLTSPLHVKMANLLSLKLLSCESPIPISSLSTEQNAFNITTTASDIVAGKLLQEIANFKRVGDLAISGNGQMLADDLMGQLPSVSGKLTLDGFVVNTLSCKPKKFPHIVLSNCAVKTNLATLLPAGERVDSVIEFTKCTAVPSIQPFKSVVTEPPPSETEK